MKLQIIKKTAMAAFATASLAGFLTMGSTQPAEATHKIWHLVAAGVVAGVVINEVTKNRRRDRHRRFSEWDAHVEWCYDNRPRYRESDNTYRRSGRSRRECFSPYYD